MPLLSLIPKHVNQLLGQNLQDTNRISSWQNVVPGVYASVRCGYFTSVGTRPRFKLYVLNLPLVAVVLCVIHSPTKGRTFKWLDIKNGFYSNLCRTFRLSVYGVCNLGRLIACQICGKHRPTNFAYKCGKDKSEP